MISKEESLAGPYLKFNLVKGIVGGNGKDSGEIRFGEEGLAVVYLGDAYVGAGGIILSFIANR